MWNWWKLYFTGDVEQALPCWVVKVPKEILNGHGDIFNPNAIDMMVALFRLSNLLEPSGAPVPPIMIKSKPEATGQSLVPATTAASPTPLEEAPTAATTQARKARPSTKTPARLKLSKRRVVEE